MTEIDRNKTDRNRAARNKIARNKTKRNKTDINKTDMSKTDAYAPHTNKISPVRIHRNRFEQAFFLAAFATFVFFSGCGKADQKTVADLGNNRQCNLSESSETADIFTDVPEDSEMIWQGEELLPEGEDISADHKQLRREGDSLALTCCSSSLSAQADGRRYLFDKDGKLEIIFPDWLKESEEYGRVFDCVYKEDGKLLLFYGKRTDYDNLDEIPVHSLREYDPTLDTYTDLVLSLPPNTAYARFTLLSDETLVFFDEGDYQAVSCRIGVAEPLARFHAMYREGGWLDLGDGKLAVRQSVSEGYVSVDARTGERLEAFTPQEVFESEAARCARLIRTEEGLALLNGMGLFYKKTSDAESSDNGWEQRLAAQDTVMYDPAFLLNAFMPDGVGFYAASDGQLYHYTPEIVKKTEKKELILVSLRPDPMIQSAAVSFKLLHPEVRVDFQVMLPEEFPESSETEEAIRRLNAEIISGKSMDLLITDGLPFASYGEKGVLEDLSGFTAGWPEEEYYKQPLTAQAKDGALYSLITSFSPVALVLKESVDESVSTLEGLAGYLEDHKDSTFFAPEMYADPAYLEAVLYELYFPEVLSDGGKKLSGNQEYANGEAGSREDGSKKDESEKSESREGVSKEKLTLYLKTWKTLVERMEGRTASVSYARYYLPEAAALLKENSPAAAALLTELGNSFMWATPLHTEGLKLIPSGRFIPGTGVGLCKNAPEKELAKEFLSFLFSEKVQESNATYIPVRRSSHLKQLTRNLKWGAEKMGWEPGKAYAQADYGSLLMYIPKEEELDRLTGLYEQSRIPFRCMRNNVSDMDDLLKILHERSERYLNGDRLPEEAVKDVYDGILLYTQEQV